MANNVSPAITTWSKGEISPQLKGRVDIQQYYSSADRLTNCIVRPYGNVVNRAGSHYVYPVKDEDQDQRLIPFVFSTSEAYIIEMGPEYFRFFKNHEVIRHIPIDEGPAADDDYTLTENNDLHFILRGAVTLINPLGISIFETEQRNFVASDVGKYMRMKRNGVVDGEVIIVGITDVTDGGGKTYGNGGWGLSTAASRAPQRNDYPGGNWGIFNDIYNPDVGEETELEVAHTYTQEELKSVQYCQKDDVMYLAHKNHPPAKLIRSSDTDWTLENTVSYGGPFETVNSNTNIKISATVKTPAGAATVLDVETGGVATAGFWTSDNVGEYFKYGGVDEDNYEKQGYVTIDSIIGDGSSCNCTIVEPLDKNGTYLDEWAFQEWTEASGYPVSVTFHESRLCWARNQKIWMSKSFIYDNYITDDGGTHVDDNAINIEINTEQSNQIQWISAGNTLLVGTSGGEFVVAAGSEGALTTANANAKRQTGWGSENVRPTKISNFLYYLQRGGRKIREIFYNWDLDSYKSNDVTVFSDHITESTVLDMAYQQNPDSMLWCIKGDGEICALTREANQEIMAWIPVETDGEYKTTAVIPRPSSATDVLGDPSGLTDEVWIVVERENGKYLEYFESHVVTDNTYQRDLFYVDSGVTYNAYGSTYEGLVGLFVGISDENTFTAVASSEYFTEDMVGKRISLLNDDLSQLTTLTIEEVDVDQVTVRGTTTYTVSTVDEFLPGYWGVSVDEVTGLEHLANQTCSILADGGVEKQQIVTFDGVVPVETDNFVIHVGLPYESTLKTNKMNVGSNRGTGQGKLKRISEVSMEVYRTLGISIGDDEDNLHPFQFRQEDTPIGEVQPLYTGEVANISFDGDINYKGQMVVQQSEPLSMNILGIYPRLKTEDK